MFEERIIINVIERLESLERSVRDSEIKYEIQKKRVESCEKEIEDILFSEEFKQGLMKVVNLSEENMEYLKKVYTEDRVKFFTIIEEYIENIERQVTELERICRNNQ